MHGHKNCHPQPANPMQDERQLGTFSPVAQAYPQRHVPFQAHLCLLERNFLEKLHIMSFMAFPLKVTILMGYSFQTSSNKEGIDLYNPEYITIKRSYSTACLQKK